MSEISFEPGMRMKLVEQQADFGGNKEVKMEKLTWAELDQKLRAAVEAKANGRAFDVAKLNALVEERNERVEEVKRLGFPGDRNKAVVADRQRAATNEWPAAKQQFVGGGLAATDPIERFEADMDAAARTWTSRSNQLVDNKLLDDPRLGGVVVAWVDGVKRTVEIRKTTDEISARQQLGMSLGQLEEDLRYLQAEAEVLDWGGLRNSEHRRNVADLVNASMDYERTAGANRADWFRAEKRVNTPQAPATPDRNNRRRGDASANFFAAERIPATPVDSAFDTGFLRTHGLPDELYGQARMTAEGYKQFGMDVGGLLDVMYRSGDIPAELSQAALEDYVIQSGGDQATMGQRLKEIRAVWGELVDGIAPLILLKIKFKDGKFGTLGGTSKSSGLLSPGGVGNRLDLNVKDVARVWSKDETAKRALGMWFYMDGENVGRMTPEDRRFADRFKAEITSIVHTSPKEIGFLQDDVRIRMEQIATEMSRYLGCGEATPTLMLYLATAMGVKPLIGDYRKIYTNGGPHETFLKADSNEVATKPILYQLKLGKGEASFGYVENALARDGVDGLFIALNGLKDGHDLAKYHGSMAMVLDALDDAEVIESGADDFPNTAARKAARDALFNALVAKRQIPLIGVKTLQALRARKVFEGGSAMYRPPSSLKEIGGVKGFWEHTKKSLTGGYEQPKSK